MYNLEINKLINFQMMQSFSKLIFMICFILACTSNNPKRNLEEDEKIDECIEFITDIIPIRLENLKEPIVQNLIK